MKLKELKTIDINAKEWFDQVNGNSYFSSVVTLNFGQPNEKKIILPFQYGYGSQYHFESMEQIKKLFPRSHWYKKIMFESEIKKKYNLTINSNIKKNCLKRELHTILMIKS